MSRMTITEEINIVLEKEENDKLDARLRFDCWFWYDDAGLKIEGLVTERVDDNDEEVVLILIGGRVVVVVVVVVGVVDGLVLTSCTTDMSAILLCCCTITWTPTQITNQEFRLDLNRKNKKLF